MSDSAILLAGLIVSSMCLVFLVVSFAELRRLMDEGTPPQERSVEKRARSFDRSDWH